MRLLPRPRLAVLPVLAFGCDRPSKVTRLRDEAVAAPADANRRGQLGLAYDANLFAEAARTCLEQARALDPDAARWPYHVARLTAEAGDLEGALEILAEAEARSPRFAPIHWRRGQWLLDLGRTDDAEDAFATALELSPESVPADGTVEEFGSFPAGGLVELRRSP